MKVVRGLVVTGCTVTPGSAVWRTGFRFQTKKVGFFLQAVGTTEGC